MNDDQNNKRRPKGFALSGCLFTFLTWLMAAFAVIGWYMGDCFPELGGSCPTDSERNLRLLWIALAAIAVNAVGLFLIARNHVRASQRD